MDPNGRRSGLADRILGETNGHVVRPLLIFVGVHETEKIVCAKTSDRCEGEATQRSVRAPPMPVAPTVTLSDLMALPAMLGVRALAYQIHLLEQGILLQDRADDVLRGLQSIQMQLRPQTHLQLY